jgi:hypothetical protein
VLSSIELATIWTSSGWFEFVFIFQMVAERDLAVLARLARPPASLLKPVVLEH